MARKKYVLGFVICLETQQVLLMKKIKPVWQEGFFNGIGGKIEPTEHDIFAPMERETREETGLIIPADTWKYFATMYSEYWIVHCLTVNIPEKLFENYRTQEEEEVEAWDFSEIHCSTRPILGNIPWLVGMAVDSLCNPHSFEAPEIKYNDYSFPLHMNQQNKLARIEAERKIEKSQ